MRNTTFEVLFKGKENAQKMIDGIAEYATKAYGKETLSGGVQLMASFGIDQGNIMPNLKAIGEIAMGNKGRFDSLTLAFSQMSATGSLMGQDLLQMVNAGFNPLQQMSITTGKSVGQLKAEMGKGLITTEMVTQAFRDATSAGGMFYGMTDRMSQEMGGQMSLAFANINAKLVSLYNFFQPYLLPAFRAFNLLMSDTTLFFDKMGQRISSLSTTAKVLGTIMLWLASTITVVTARTAAYAAITKVITALKSAETIAWWANNMAMLANPVTWIVAAVIALIGVIAFLIIKVDGWGETWDNVVKFATLVFEGFKEGVISHWLQVQNGFMTGLEIIEAGWYKLQSLWDSDAANKGLENLQAQRDARAKEIAAQQGKLQDIKNQLAGMQVITLKMNDTSLGDVVDKMKNTMGISTPKVAGMDSGALTSGAGGGTGGKDSKTGAKTANAIATGGTKTTHITLTIRDLVGNMNITAGNITESAKKIRDIVVDEMSRALTMAQANV
ncbi:tape measure protein [Dysgonomonas sp. ZJ279]|uniref:tape measure protein n=1 Tax=Dysgonomonas sp. ZJ279 TaxID=2709796 RepID=UPI002105BC0B|nr:tape measure protein [Dysgonomonas sp. ZJ279]